MYPHFIVEVISFSLLLFLYITFTLYSLICLFQNCVKKCILQDKIELETKDEQNKTPMQLAEEQGQKDIVDYLKEKKRKSFWPSFDLW